MDNPECKLTSYMIEVQIVYKATFKRSKVELKETQVKNVAYKVLLSVISKDFCNI